MTFIHSFDPIIDNNSRVLILGSMPGKISLEKGEYYAYAKNAFWTIIYSIFKTLPDQGYQDRISFLRSRNIALWDVIKECGRSGSSDSRIINPIINDFEELLTRYPNIKYIFFNGKKAENLFLRNINNISKPNISHFALPSTSPANASISLSNKQKAWSLIRELA